MAIVLLEDGEVVVRGSVLESGEVVMKTEVLPVAFECQDASSGCWCLFT